jgi:YHS domain-containing protein
MMRQICKQILTIAAWALLALGAQAQPSVETIVTDPLTGVAIDGYDAVTYFISSEPQQGKPDFEYSWGGVSWYFASAANRDVFALNPETYAPQFGGHCATSLSRGYLSDGKPRLYVIEALKLYFFYSTANRDAFLLSKTPTIAKALENWPNLSKGLPPPGSEPPPEPASSPPADASAPVAPGGAGDNVQSH